MKTHFTTTSPASFFETDLLIDTSDKNLENDPLKSLQEELYQKYNPEIVDEVFRQVRRYNFTNLPKSEANRVRLYCHYYDLEQKATDQAIGQSAAVKRILRRYTKHARTEINSILGQKKESRPLTFNDLDQAYQNFLTLIETIPLMLQRYDEWICHRSLNHFSILSSEVLCGHKPFPQIDLFFESIDEVFSGEIRIRRLIEVMRYEDLQKNYELISKQILKLLDPYSVKELQLELSLKTGRVKAFTPLVNKHTIENYARLFNASLEGTRWAEDEAELIPLDKSIQNNLNNVFFLKSKDSPSNEEKIAVFKAQGPHTASGAMEALAYDTCLIFGLSEGLVPTKPKQLKDMFGSIQIFQDGLNWDQFKAKSKEEQNAIVKKITLKSYLQAGLSSILIGNRDLHMNNFFFVEKENDEYGIVVFDNELCFQYSNHVLTSYKNEGDVPSNPEASIRLDPSQFNEAPFGPMLNDRESFLPLRCALLVLPQADQPIAGETKKWLQDLIATWPAKFDEFFNYLNSPLGLQKLHYLPGKRLHHDQLRAFKERVEKLIYYINSDKAYTYRDLLKRVYPLFADYFNLTKILYPSYPEFWVGVRSAEYMCQKAVKQGVITADVAQKFLEKVHDHAKM